MLIKVLKHIFLFFILAITQIAILPNMPSVLEKLNIVLVVVIFIAVVYEFYMSAAYALLLGFLLDLYSSLPFGAMILSLMITLYVIYKIFKKLLTNKSFYTLIGLTIVGTFVHSLILYIYLYIIFFVQTKDMELIKKLSFMTTQDFLWQLLFNLIAITCLFMFFHVAGRRFKAVFIDTTKG